MIPRSPCRSPAAPPPPGTTSPRSRTVAVTGTTTVTGLTVTPSTGVTVLIRDDDVRGVAIVPTDLTIDEGQTGTYSVVLTAQPTGEVTVTLSLPADAAVSVRPTSVVFTATEWNKAEPVRITATADADAEDEQVTIGHTVAGADYGSASAADVAVTVVDDDTPSTAIKLRADRVSVAEGGGDRTVTVTAALDEAALKAETTETTVQVAVGAETATPGEDFAVVDAFEVTIPAGAASGSATFTLSPVSDDVDEDDETLSLTGQVVESGTPVVDALPVTGATVTIVDDDSRGVEVSTTALTVEEGGQASYTIRLTSAPSQDATVEVVPPANADLMVSPTHYYFTRDDWSAPQTVGIIALTDADLTDDAVTLTHDVTGGDYAGIAVDDVAVIITEPTSSPMTVQDARAAEGSGPLAFEVTLEKAISVQATVQYQTVGMTGTNGVTAKPGEDYTGRSGTLTFAAGETRQTVQVSVLDEALNEAEEYFQLVLQNPVNAELPQPTPQARTVQGIIEDDDPLPVLRVVGSTADGGSYGQESSGPLSYTVLLRPASSRDVTVDYVTEDRLPGGRNTGGLGTATSTVDYAPLQGMLQFAAGETEKRLTVTVTADAVSESDEAFALQLKNPRNALLWNQGWGVIRDEDVRGVVLSPPALTMDEGAVETYMIALSSQPTAAVTVTLAPSAAVTVTAGQDADAVDGTATIMHSFTGGDYDGEDADDMTVTIRDDETQDIQVEPTGARRPGGGLGSARLRTWRAFAGGGQRGYRDRDLVDHGCVRGPRGTGISGQERSLCPRGEVGWGTGADGLGDRRAAAGGNRGRASAAAAAGRILCCATRPVRRVDAVAGGRRALRRRCGGDRRRTGGRRRIALRVPRLGGLTIAANGRWLIVHEDRAYEQWGVGASIRVAPVSASRGPSLTLNTACGDTANTVQQLWSQGAALPGGSGAEAAFVRPGRFEAELGYGIEAPGGAVVTPYAGVALEDGGAHAYRVGGRLSLAPAFVLDLEATRHERPDKSDHGLRVSGTLSW